MKDQDPLAQDAFLLAKLPKEPKRKRVKRGILGVPRTNRALFMVGQPIDSDEDEGEDQDPSFTLSADEADAVAAKPTQKRKRTSLAASKRPPVVSASSDGGSSDGGWHSGVPYEILFKIFRYHMLNARGNLLELDRLKEVCQPWSRVAQDPKLLFHLDFSQHSVMKTPRGPGTLKRIVSKLNLYFTERLDLSGIPIVYENLEAIVKKCHADHLLHLNLSNCPKVHKSAQAGKSYLRLIGDRLPKLATLKLAQQNKPFSGDDFAYLFAKLGGNLKVLDLSHNVLSWNNLKDVADHCPNLESLELSYCQFKSPKNARIDFDYLGQKWPRLRELNLIRSNPKTRFTSAESMMTGDACFGRLECLNLAFETTHGTDPMIWLMARLCRDTSVLRVLDIQTYKSPLDSNINFFSFVQSKELRKLYLCNANLSEADNFYLTHEIEYRWIDSLVELDFSWSNVRQETLKKILDVFVRGAEICSIQVLNLTGTVIDHETLKNALPKMKTLRQLNLTSCRSIERSFKRLLDADDIAKLASGTD